MGRYAGPNRIGADRDGYRRGHMGPTERKNTTAAARNPDIAGRYGVRTMGRRSRRPDMSAATAHGSPRALKTALAPTESGYPGEYRVRNPDYRPGEPRWPIRPPEETHGTPRKLKLPPTSHGIRIFTANA